jgi:hypothetical protein
MESESNSVTVRSNENKVQLGCGTLIIIALIVMIFSGGRDSDDLHREIEKLQQTVDRLEQKVDELNAKLASQ